MLHIYVLEAHIKHSYELPLRGQSNQIYLLNSQYFAEKLQDATNNDFHDQFIFHYNLIHHGSLKNLFVFVQLTQKSKPPKY